MVEASSTRRSGVRWPGVREEADAKAVRDRLITASTMSGQEGVLPRTNANRMRSPPGTDWSTWRPIGVPSQFSQRGPIRFRHFFCERVRQTGIGAASYDRSRGVP